MYVYLCARAGDDMGGESVHIHGLRVSLFIARAAVLMRWGDGDRVTLTETYVVTGLNTLAQQQSGCGAHFAHINHCFDI